MDTPHCTLSCRYLIRVLIGSSCYFHPFAGFAFLGTSFQSSHLSMPISFFLVLSPSFLCLLSFLPFHTAHYTPPSVNFIIPSHFYLITFFVSRTRAHTIRSLHSHTTRHSFPLLLVAGCHPHPPHLKLPFANHIVPPCLYHHAHPFMHLIPSLPMCVSVRALSISPPHYGPVKHVHVVTAPGNIPVASTSFYDGVPLHPPLPDLTTS